MKGEWKMRDWDSVLQALNPAKYNFSLSIKLKKVLNIFENVWKAQGVGMSLEKTIVG